MKVKEKVLMEKKFCDVLCYVHLLDRSLFHDHLVHCNESLRQGIQLYILMMECCTLYSNDTTLTV